MSPPTKKVLSFLNVPFEPTFTGPLEEQFSDRDPAKIRCEEFFRTVGNWLPYDEYEKKRKSRKSRATKDPDQLPADDIRALLSFSPDNLIEGAWRRAYAAKPKFMIDNVSHMLKNAFWSLDASTTKPFTIPVDRLDGDLFERGVPKLDDAIQMLATILRVQKSILTRVLVDADLILEGDVSAVERTHRNVPVEKNKALPLPKRARISYAKRNDDPNLAGSNIIEFLKIEYGVWLDGTLTRPMLKRIDLGAYKALQNWIATKRKIPDDFYLPTLKEANDRLLEDLLAQGKSAKELRNLGAAAARRPRRQMPSDQSSHSRHKVQTLQKH